MNNSIHIMQWVLVALFGLYQIWAYRNNKAIRIKLAPMMVSACFMLLLIGLGSFLGNVGYNVIFIILVIEMSIKSIILVLLFESLLALISKDRDFKKVAILVGALCLVTVVYYLGERVF